MIKYIKLEDAIDARCPVEYIWEDCIDCPLNDSGIEPCKMGKWLKSLPTLEVSEDCISRDWVLNRLTKYQKDYALNELDDWQNTVVEWITTDIENAPSVVPSRAEGEWVRTFDGNEWYWYCSNCKEQWYEDDLYMSGNEFPHFWPNCGADMKGEQDG